MHQAHLFYQVFELISSFSNEYWAILFIEFDRLLWPARIWSFLRLACESFTTTTDQRSQQLGRLSFWVATVGSLPLLLCHSFRSWNINKFIAEEVLWQGERFFKLLFVNLSKQFADLSKLFHHENFSFLLSVSVRYSDESFEDAHFLRRIFLTGSLVFLSAK